MSKHIITDQEEAIKLAVARCQAQRRDFSVISFTKSDDESQVRYRVYRRSEQGKCWHDCEVGERLTYIGHVWPAYGKFYFTQEHTFHA